MSEIMNYAMNFCYGRLEGLTCLCKLAPTEIHCERALKNVRGSR